MIHKAYREELAPPPVVNDLLIDKLQTKGRIYRKICGNRQTYALIIARKYPLQMKIHGPLEGTGVSYSASCLKLKNTHLSNK